MPGKEKMTTGFAANQFMMSMTLKFPLERSALKVDPDREWMLLQFYLTTVAAQLGINDHNQVIAFQKSLAEEFVKTFDFDEPALKTQAAAYEAAAKGDADITGIASHFCEKVGGDKITLMSLAQMIGSRLNLDLEIWKKINKEFKLEEGIAPFEAPESHATPLPAKKQIRCDKCGLLLEGAECPVCNIHYQRASMSPRDLMARRAQYDNQRKPQKSQGSCMVALTAIPFLGICLLLFKNLLF
ncbi:hypothetical protein OAL92_00740 [bacterium]|nr:hypothetical protein [bacterium]